MLYKKYHRSYVSQFKRGTKLRKNSERDSDIQIVTTRPFSRLNLRTGKPYITVDTTIDEHGDWIRWALVGSDGKINHRIELVENVI